MDRDQESRHPAPLGGLIHARKSSAATIGSVGRRIKGFPKHIVFFIEHEDAIEVVRILHGAQDIETELKTS